VGSAICVPNGYAHYIQNTGTETLRMAIAFTHEEPDHINLSETLDYVPREFLAETFGVSPTDFPELQYRGDVFRTYAVGERR